MLLRSPRWRPAWGRSRRARPGALADSALSVDTALEEASNAAASSRPDLAYERHRLSQAHAQSQAAYRQLAPSVLLRGGAGLSRTYRVSGVGVFGRSFDASGGLVVRWTGMDLTEWGEARQARRSIETAAQQLEALDLQVRTRATQAAYEARRAEAALAQASQVARAAQLSRTTQTEQYKAGSASLLERLDSESAEQQSRERLVEAKLAYDLARARLLTETNRLDDLADAAKK